MIEQLAEKSIFAAALERRSPEERAAYLDEACAGNAQLRADVEALLAAHDRLGPSPTAPEATTADIPATERPGAVIGPYKLLQQIGEGGMGTVWMAQQTEPVKRLVALKLVKAGMDSKAVIARFEAERQALALMDHPNIAKVLGAGTTDSGRPYFVMDLVKGAPITKYCDEHHLTPRQRLELFLSVCHAVQHAHQKGIIHRDLKPSNVLVASYDGKPVPKVIDFGVAKAAGPSLTDKTLVTGFGNIIGTLEYMSPEQAEINQLDIDTRSDIYSLGVLLYELLTGSPPFSRQELEKAGMLEMLRVIREEEPSKPSTKLSTAEGLPTLAANRGTEPAKLTKLVRGELDWIVMKALEKNRSRRYETANGFAMDIQRYLGDEPVLACPPSAAYRFRKFARRHRVGIMAASVVVSALFVLIISLAVSNRLITAERNQTAAALKDREKALDLAAAESKRAEESFLRASIAIREVLTKAAMGSGEWSMLPPPLRKRLTEEAVNFYTSLLQDDSSDPNRRYEAAVGHRAIGTLHVTARAHQQAEASFRRSIEILDRLVSQHAAMEHYRQQLAWSSVNLGRTLHSTQRTDEATAILQKAAELYEKLLAERPDSIDYQNELSTCYAELGTRLTDLRDFKQAEMVLQRGISVLESASAPERDMAGYNERLARMYLSLGRLRASDRRFPEARASFRTAAKYFEAAFSTLPTAPRFYGWNECYRDTLNVAGWGLTLAEREELYRQILELRARLPDSLKVHRDLRAQEGHTRREWASTLETTGRPREGENEFAAAARIFDQLALEQPDGGYLHFAADSHRHVARLMMLSGRNKGAEAAFRRSVDLHEQRIAKFPDYPGDDNERAASYFEFAAFLARTERLDEGLTLHRQACDILEKWLQVRPSAGGYNNLAWQFATSPIGAFRDPARAVQLAKKAIGLAPREGYAWNTLGVAHYRSGDWKAAIVALEKSMQLGGGNSFDWFFAAMAHYQLGNSAEAQKWYRRAEDWMSKHQPQDDELRRFRAEARELLEIEEKNDQGR